MREQVDDRGARCARPVYHLCFALGKALEDRGEYEESFRFYARGNALKKAESTYQPDRRARTHGARQIEALHARVLRGAARLGLPMRPTDLHRRHAARRLDAARADSRLATRRSKARWNWPTSRDLAQPARRRRQAARAIPESSALAADGRFRARSARRTCATPASTAAGTAVLHRQDAEQFPARRPDSPDAAEREDHRRAARADGLLLQQLQAAVRARPAIHLQPRGHRPLLPRLRAAHGSLGRGTARPRAARRSTRT